MDLITLDDEALDQLRRDVLTEQERRANLEQIPATVARLTRTYLDAEGTEQGDAWEQPTGAHDAYPSGWTVTHDGKTWESLVGGNVWEPGVSAWREVTTDGEPTAWVQPTGAHDAYAKGDAVLYNGQAWTSDLDGNVWVPGEYGWTPQG